MRDQLLRDYRRRHRAHEWMKIILIAGIGVILTGNAFLQMDGGRGPLTALIMQPIQTVMSLMTATTESSKAAREQPFTANSNIE